MPFYIARNPQSNSGSGGNPTDYTTDMVQPTATRQYVSQEEKEDWSSRETSQSVDSKISDAISSVDSNYVPKNMLGMPGGVVPLGEDAKVPMDYLPSDVLSDRVTTLEDSKVNQDSLISLIDQKADSVAANNVVLDQRVSATEGALSTKASLVNGKVPYSQLPDIPVGRKVAVANRAARLALPIYADITIAYESDTGDAFALDANDDPAIDPNWTKLGNAQGIGVASFNGRTGNIGPQSGDYITEMIAETDLKRFVSTDQMVQWSSAPNPDLIDQKLEEQKTANDAVYETKNNAASVYMTKTSRGAPSGVAPLGTDSRVPVVNLPTHLPQTKRVWRDVKASRSVGVWVTNTSNNEMLVHVRAFLSNTANRFISLQVRENSSSTVFVFNSTVLTPMTSGIGYADSGTITVPAGWQYQLASVGGSTIDLTERWYEMY